jgi:hypothetical protein
LLLPNSVIYTFRYYAFRLANIIDQNIQPAMPGDDIGYPAVDIGFCGYIAAPKLTDSASIDDSALCALAIGFVNIYPFNQAALRCEQLGGCASIAPGAVRRANTGYRNHLIFH